MAGKFKGNPQPKRIAPRLYETQKEFIYTPSKKLGYRPVIIPMGFTTDFASSPRIAWSIIPPDGEYTEGAITHDFIYHTQIRGRKEADKIFLDAMKTLDVSWWKRRIMYRYVRTLGWIPWMRRAKEIKAEHKAYKARKNLGKEETEKM